MGVDDAAEEVDEEEGGIDDDAFVDVTLIIVVGVELPKERIEEVVNGADVVIPAVLAPVGNALTILENVARTTDTG